MNTKTVTISGFIVFDAMRARYPDIWPGEGFNFTGYEPSGDSQSTVVRPHTFTVEVPADFDPRPGMVKALEEKKRKAHAEFSALVAQIDRQISELQAIEYTPEAA